MHRHDPDEDDDGGCDVAVYPPDDGRCAMCGLSPMTWVFRSLTIGLYVFWLAVLYRVVVRLVGI